MTVRSCSTREQMCFIALHKNKKSKILSERGAGDDVDQEEAGLEEKNA